MAQKPVKQLVVGFKGAGEMASAVAHRLYRGNIRGIFMMEIACPLAVRREVSFCEAVHEGTKVVEGVEAVLVGGAREIEGAWSAGKIAVLVDPHWSSIETVRPDVVVDAILAKKNLGTSRREAPLVIALGPGFVAGDDVHVVIETNRGHNLGRVIIEGSAEPNTGVPGEIGGHAAERVLRAPVDGFFISGRKIGDRVTRGEVVGLVEDLPVQAGVDGVIRGLLRSETPVRRGMKIGDVDPRGQVSLCETISDKARAIGGAVLEAILGRYNV